MARIRTIKPEFWQSPELASVSEFARLLAIALLNHSDDEGYFKANEFLVRAACFPFEESSERVRGAIQELSGINYIAIRAPSLGKEIGRVVNFKSHQRIDKPKPSSLAEQFASCEGKTSQNPSSETDSKNDLGRVVDESSTSTRLEQGTGNREQGNGTGKREEGKKAAATAADSIDPALVEFCEWWNTLHANDLVLSKVKSDPPCESLSRKWRSLRRNPEVREAISRREDIEAKLRVSSFAKKANWLTAAKMLGGTNKDGEVIVVKLLNDGYADSQATRGRVANTGSGVNYTPGGGTDATF